MRRIGESIKEERLKFKKGFQKKFLENIKEKSGLNWEDLARELNLCRNTVAFYWRNEESTIPLSFAKRLLKEYPFQKWGKIEQNWVEKVLPKNWGQELSGGLNKKIITIPQRSEELSEFLGVILGDGHLDKKTLTITGNYDEKEHYYYLMKKIKRLFNLDSKILKLKNQNGMQLRINSTELIKYLLDNSFVLGNKIENKESLPKWIFEKEEFVCGALRGLLDTDGGIYQKQKKYKRAIIEFQTESPHIRKDLFELIEKAGFKPSKSDVNVRIQNQKEVRKFLAKVGCANPKNIVRCKHFIETGEIPLKEKLKNEIISLKVEEPFKAALV